MPRAGLRSFMTFVRRALLSTLEPAPVRSHGARERVSASSAAAATPWGKGESGISDCKAICADKPLFALVS